MTALYYDEPGSTRPDELRSDAAIVVGQDVALAAGLREEYVAGGTYACVLHRGSYAELGGVGRLMGEWLPASGRQRRDSASYERYFNGTMDVSEEDPRTELYLGLA